MRICQQQLQVGCWTEESLGDFRASVQKIKIKYWTKPCLNTVTQKAMKGQGLFSSQQLKQEGVTIRRWCRLGNEADDSVLSVKWLLSKLGNSWEKPVWLPTDLPLKVAWISSSMTALTFRNVSRRGWYLQYSSCLLAKHLHTFGADVSYPADRTIHA